MIRSPAFPVDEIRGRLLHEALLAEGREEFERWASVALPPTQEAPTFPVLAKTETGTMHAVVIAS